jgi:hypothetical protein
VYVLHGGEIPPEYLEVILRRELHLTTADLERMSAATLNAYIACLQGEAKGLRERQERERWRQEMRTRSR